MPYARLAAVMALPIFVSACAATTPSAQPDPLATTFTRAQHAAVQDANDLGDAKAMADARRGLVAAPSGQVRAEDGRVVWDFDSFAFVQGTPPQTVNPSLWRQARLNNQAGLFKVAEGVWQLRGFDLANLTLVEGRTGWIVVDALSTRETASAAMAFVRQHLGERPVSAVVFTHSHVDHFGGALGVVSAREAAERRIPVVAPAGFMAEATSENLLLGTAMGRRAGYMYGAGLPRNAQGLVDNGLGKAVAMGRMGVLAPTVSIDKPAQELVLDGVPVVFHYTPNSEAPAGLVLSLPRQKAFLSADMTPPTLHNLYTLRGAKVRDALEWARQIDAMIGQLDGAQVLLGQHSWPVWGHEDIVGFLKAQRDAYRYIHDQTVRGMNAGLTAPEIAETLRLPPSLEKNLAVHGYYGTVKHNVRAVYQHYLGWFDAHPANLDPLPPVESARRYVALAGGAGNALAQAQAAYDQGEYRWAAQLLRHVVLTDSTNMPARELQARTFEQLGYQAESASWRNFYLVGARELRQGPPPPRRAGKALADMLPHIPTERFLEAMSVNLDGPRAAGLNTRVNLVLTDTGERFGLWLENAVLHHKANAALGAADVTLTLPRPAFLGLLSGADDAQKILQAPSTRIEGDPQALRTLLSLLARGAGNFPVVTR